jgi:hypothetical protein
LPAKNKMSLLFAALTMLLGSALISDQAAAQKNSCRQSCWHAYGACYKATDSRARCQAQLKRCLDGCIGQKR